jgi:hypothetical protein
VLLQDVPPWPTQLTDLPTEPRPHLPGEKGRRRSGRPRAPLESAAGASGPKSGHGPTGIVNVSVEAGFPASALRCRLTLPEYASARPAANVSVCATDGGSGTKGPAEAGAPSPRDTCRKTEKRSRTCAVQPRARRQTLVRGQHRCRGRRSSPLSLP